jgi:glutaredoxin/glutathione-dependent peroxiredoxin
VIKAGDHIPPVPTRLITADGVSETTADTVLGTGRVVFFAVPGAFTPTCDASHLPGFLSNTGKFRALGVDRLVCATVNDHHVTKAWAERSEALGKIDFIADTHAELAAALGLTRHSADLGTRFRRSAMVIEHGVVQHIFLEDAPGVAVTGAPAILLVLEATGQRLRA